MTVTTRDPSQGVNRTVLASTISALLAGGGAAQAQETGLEEITVTGSRIVRRDLEAASPIVTIDTERLENSSTLSVESVLNQMPQFVPEGTQFDQGLQAGPTASLGIGSLNLRGIGPNRTLVLVDGRRAQPANAALIVDINTIPSAAIERVETITGGASAVYGADAMAGVVNFILKDDFEGVEMDFQTGATTEGDGEETRFTSLLGVNAGDGDGNVMLGIEWYHRGDVLLYDRDFYRNGWFDPGSNAGGFLQAPGYSPNTTNQPFGTGGPPTQAAVDSDFRGARPATFPARLRRPSPLARRVRASSRSRTPPRSTSTATARRSCWPARAATTRASTRRPVLPDPATATPACAFSRTATWGRSRTWVKPARRSIGGRCSAVRHATSTTT